MKGVILSELGQSFIAIQLMHWSFWKDKHCCLISTVVMVALHYALSGQKKEKKKAISCLKRKVHFSLPFSNQDQILGLISGAKKLYKRHLCQSSTTWGLSVFFSWTQSEVTSLFKGQGKDKRNFFLLATYFNCFINPSILFGAQFSFCNQTTLNTNCYCLNARRHKYSHSTERKINHLIITFG